MQARGTASGGVFAISGSPRANAQRLVWLAGEAVCAVPEVAAVWPRPAIAPPFYGFGPDGASQVKFAGRDAILLRGRTSAPFGRFRAWLRAIPWRSPGVTVGRVLFHLERYGVPAVRLLAFGQRFTQNHRGVVRAARNPARRVAAGVASDRVCR